MTLLSARLRADTSEVHRAAESSLFVTRLLAGSLAVFDYCRMMMNLHAIYQELERQLRVHADNALVQHIADPRLARASAIEHDLKHLMGEHWQENIQLEHATREHLERLTKIGSAEPARLVAHAYVRYLGDLSGGQIICRAVRPTLGAAADDALAFYDFGNKAEVAELKSRFREGLDRIELEQQAIIDEALWVFHGAQRLFEQLALNIDSGPDWTAATSS